MTAVTITLELEPEAAAALKRFVEKVGWSEAMAVLYPHVKADLRSDQAHQIVWAVGRLERALDEAGVCSWPWIETGRSA